MKNNIIKLSGILFILSFLCCKKNDKSPEPASTQNPGSGTSSNSNVTTSNATSFSGIFTTGTYTSVMNLGTFTGVNARAYFSNTPTPFISNSSSVKVASVYLNGDSLTYNPSYKYYIPVTFPSLASETWSVNGANGIGTFNYTHSAATPSCTNLNNLPDSISKASGFTVTVNNISNITSATFLLFDGTGMSTGYYTIGLSAGNNTVNVTSSMLSALATTTNGNIAVVMSNAQAVSYNGKDYQFSREAQYTRQIKIKP